MPLNVNPMFSICICNRNMADTLEISLSSIFDQIDDRFEVIVIDDGSTDGSLAILDDLKHKHSNLRYYSLLKDRKRKLGFTRNISIQKAQGDWVILHLDADDLIGQGIVNFVEGVLRIHSASRKPALYSGHQIHMAPREWLLSFGPYRNLYRLEDRDLYQRLIPNDQWRIILHGRFIERLERTRKKTILKTARDAFEHLVSDTRYSASFKAVIVREIDRESNGKRLLKLFRLVLLPLAYVFGRRLGVIETLHGDFSNQGVRRYRNINTRSVDEWVSYLNSQT